MDNIISAEELFGAYANGEDPLANYGDVVTIEGIATYIGPDM